MHHIPINSHKNCCYCISDSAETTVPSNTCYIWLYNSTVSFLQSFIWRRQMVQFTVNPVESVVCPGTQKCSDINWRVLLRTSALFFHPSIKTNIPFYSQSALHVEIALSPRAFEFCNPDPANKTVNSVRVTPNYWPSFIDTEKRLGSNNSAAKW